MSLEIGRIDHDGLGFGPLGGQTFLHPAEHAHLAPPLPAIVQGLVGAVFPGSVLPTQAVPVDNTLDRQFDVAAPNRAWVTDITYIRTLEGFAYLAVVIDLYSRRVVGWSIQSRQTTDVMLQALHMAVWRRKPKQRVLIHSAQFPSMDWAAFIQAHNLEHSMSRRGNGHDNAVAESFFSSLKREHIRRRTYKTREEARQDVFDYVEMFYNSVREQVRNGMLSLVQFERQQILKAQGV